MLGKYLGKGIPDKRNSMCKDLEAGKSLICQRNENTGPCGKVEQGEWVERAERW